MGSSNSGTDALPRPENLWPGSTPTYLGGSQPPIPGLPAPWLKPFSHRPPRMATPCGHLCHRRQGALSDRMAMCWVFTTAVPDRKSGAAQFGEAWCRRPGAADHARGVERSMHQANRRTAQAQCSLAEQALGDHRNYPSPAIKLSLCRVSRPARSFPAIRR